MTDADLIARIERIEARQAIQQLPTLYALAVDTHDLDAVVALFVDDVDCGSRGRGRAVLRDLFDGLTSAGNRSIHQIVGHNFGLIDADHASGTVYCRAEQEQAGRWVVATMAYFDRYERRAGAWYFASRKFAFWYGADVFEQPAAGALPASLRAAQTDVCDPVWSRFWAERGEALVAGLGSRG